LPLVKPPWGRITAINLNTGEHVWMIANGAAPDYVKDHPLMRGIDTSKMGRPERSPLMVTKTLLFQVEGAGLFTSAVGGGGKKFRAIDKKTGAIVHEMELPMNATGVPMTYMHEGSQYIVTPIGGAGFPAELIALKLP
jgi:quinoprotein glucose dehydrogenase